MLYIYLPEFLWEKDSGVNFLYCAFRTFSCFQMRISGNLLDNISFS